MAAINRKTANEQSTNQTGKTAAEQLQTEQEKEAALLRDLIKKEAELQQLEQTNKQLTKEQQNMEKSKTWQYAKPISKVSRLSEKTKNLLTPGSRQQTDLLAENETLQQKVTALETALQAKEAELQTAKLAHGKLDSGQLETAAKTRKSQGEILEYLETLISQKQTCNHTYNEALRQAAKAYNKERDIVKHAVYTKALEGFHIEEIPEFIVREAETAETVALQQAASFRASLTMRARTRQFGGTMPEWVLDNKAAAYRFIDDLNISRPWTSEAHYPLAAIPEQDGIVVKPADGSGSRGVYLVFSANEIQDVKRNRLLTSWDDVRASMKEDLASGWVDSDEWMTEQLIIENEATKQPAKDLKFYCFYGKVALILEISRFPELKYCWWTATGERIGTGKYEEALFKGEGATDRELELAALISEQIPAPFIRIDFLKTSNGIFFGEFTPKPGNYDTFDLPTDQWLGDCFLEAEGRLSADLLAGKPFSAFQKLLPQTGK